MVRTKKYEKKNNEKRKERNEKKCVDMRRDVHAICKPETTKYK